ncbi:MAG: hypothetical protein ACJ76J_11945 [Thermoanaerobaculia bacterium]
MRKDCDLSAQDQAKIERRFRNQVLMGLLDQLDAQHGPVDEFLVEKYLKLLG